jgi:hypothetical protein
VHPQAVAGWHCEACDVLLCTQCAARSNQTTVCGRCGRLVTTLLMPRSERYPFLATWRATLKHLLTARAALWLFIFTWTIGALLTLAPRGWLTARVLLLGWVFFLARRLGRGLDPFGQPTYGDVLSVVRGPLVRGLPVLAPFIVMVLIFVDAGSGYVALTATADVITALVAVPVLGLALPMVAVEGEGRQWAWPWRLPAFARTLGRDAWPLLMLLAGALVLELIAARLPPFRPDDTRLEVAIARTWAAHFGVVLCLSALGIVTGHLLFTRAAELGHDSGEPDEVPRLLVTPTHDWVPPVTNPEEVARARAARFQPIEVESPQAQLASALTAGQVEQAISLFRSGDVPLTSIGNATLVALAQALAGKGEARAAADLLELLSTRAADEFTPKGLVILARLFAERLSDPARAVTLYQTVVQRFPDTRAAEFAKGQLTSLRGA